jgi:membrane associated rhomboid family serine protease
VVGIAVDRSGGVNGRSGGGFETRLALDRNLVATGEFWRLLTSGFLHFGVMHLAFNMFSLWNLGRILEPLLGHVRFLGLYVASLLAGSLGVVVLQRAGVQDFSLHGGASGAVFGLLGALAVAFQQRGMSIMRSGLGASLLINLLITFTLNVSIGGHMGGLVGGALCGYFMLSTQRARINTPIAKMIPVLVGVAAAAGAVIVSYS